MSMRLDPTEIQGTVGGMASDQISHPNQTVAILLWMQEKQPLTTGLSLYEVIDEENCHRREMERNGIVFSFHQAQQST